MSVIAGIVRFDDAPIAPDVLERFAARIGSRGPDGTTVWRDGSAGFVYGRLDVTPESEHEPQPLVDAASGLAAVFDGRLDNRDDLLRALNLDPATGDAAVTLHAHRAWGDAAVERLRGDFAFAVWDAARRRLACGRDSSGVRTLLFREGPGWIAFASEIDLLAACIDPMPPPNEGMAGEYLSGIVTSTRETLFQTISRLPAAHAHTASAGGSSVRCYWRPDPLAEIRYARDEEYEEHLAGLMRTVVASRLRTRRPVAVMLSGGLDSSAVTAVATDLCRGGSVACETVEALSISVPDERDERAFFELVTTRLGLPAHRLIATLPAPGQFREEIARDLEVQLFPHAPTVDPLRALVRDHGARVLLTGMGGDDWFGSSHGAYADLLRRGRLGALARRARDERRAADFGGWPAIARAAVWPLVPAPLQRLVKRALRKGRPPAWIEPSFAARISLMDRLAQHEAGIAFPTFEQRDIWHEGASGMIAYSFESTARSISRFGVEHWHPYKDRRIVEFGLALPADQRWRGGRHKDLLRRTMAASLPAAVIDRTDNPDADHVFVQAIDAETGPRRFDALETDRRGWTRGSELRAMDARMRRLYQSGISGYASPAWSLWGVLATNLWLEAANVVQ